MALPTADSLLASLAALEREIATQETAWSNNTFTAHSADGNVTIVADGSPSLRTVTIAQSFVDDATPATLAETVRAECASALAAANADTFPRARAAGSAWQFAGLPSQGGAPPTDDGFDATVSRVLAPIDAIDAALRVRRFHGSSGDVVAVASGALDLVSLAFPAPLPVWSHELEDAVVAAVNEAIEKAKRLFEDTAGTIVDLVTKGGPGPGAGGAERRVRTLFVVDATTLDPADLALRTRLVALGCQVETKAANATKTSDADGRDLIVISESTLSKDLIGKFRNTAVPMLVLEPALWNNFGMTGSVWQTDFGEALDQRRLDIRDAAHPLAAGHPVGEVAVTSSGQKFVWGKPAATAKRIARLVGRPDAWGIFAYEAGDAMLCMNAPARRVGWFAGRDAAVAFTPAAWRLFDSTVRWLTSTRFLLVVGALPLSSADAALKARLEQVHRAQVTVRLAADGNVSDLREMRAIVISESSWSAEIKARYRDVSIPVINCEPASWNAMKMTGSKWMHDFGDAQTQTQLRIQRPEHPLAGGQSGLVTVATTGQKFVWGRPSAQAIQLASLPGDDSAFGVFAYEAGVEMVGMRAPALRVGFFAGRDTPSALTSSGWALFDAAVRWVRKPRALLVVGAIPLSSSDEALKQRLKHVFGLGVDVQLARDVSAAHAGGRRLVVVSESTYSKDLGARLAAVAVPTIVLEPAAWEAFGMTGSGWMNDFGESLAQTQVEIRTTDHPLAAGLPAGRAAVVAAPGAKLVWGKPAASALKVATIDGRTDAWVVFAYERGAAMRVGTAPARRAGWFAGRDTPASLTEQGWALFDAAVRWAAGPFDAVVTVEDLPELLLAAGA